MLASKLIAVSLSVSVAFASLGSQDKSPTAPALEGLPTHAPGVQAHKWISIDGKQATPGRIPEGTSQAALKLWNEVLAASRIKQVQGPTPPVTSFDLTFEARLRSKPGAPSNDDGVNFKFLDEGRGYLSAAFKSKRRTVRGPGGDYLFDGKEWISMQGREDQESRRELNRWVAIARNFIALTQPAAVRVMELRALAAIPPTAHAGPTSDAMPQGPARPLTIEFGGGRFVSLPNQKLMAAAQGLRWLEVTSPDFRLFDSGKQRPGAQPMAYRAMLGLDPDGRIRLAQFHEDNGGAVHLQGALFVEIKSWKALRSGYVLPREINTFRADAERGHTAFEVQPTLGLWLFTNSARINPKLPSLKASDFTPND